MPVTDFETGTFNLGGPAIRGVPQYYSSGPSGSTATFTVAKDSRVVAGDVIFIFVTWNGTKTNPTVSGFTSYTKTANVFGMALFSRAADGTEGTSFTVNFASGFNVSAVCVAYQNTNGALDPVPASSGTINLATTTITGTGVTTTAPNDTLIWFGAARANGPGAPTPVITVPPGLVRRGTQSSTTNTTGTNMAVLVADQLVQAPGATGDQDGTSSIAADVGGCLIALQSPLVPLIAQAAVASATGAAQDATITHPVTHAGLASATAAAQDVNAASGTIVGAFIDETQYGLTTSTAHHTTAINNWQSNTGRFMAVERLYEGAGQLPSSIPTNPANSLAAGRVIALSFKPFISSLSYTFVQSGSPLSSGSTQATLDTAFNTCMAGLVTGGCNASNSIIPLWHEPITTGGITSSADFIHMFQHYAPMVHSHGLLTAFVTAAGTVWANSENSYYPGDSFVDHVGTDWYFPQFGYGHTTTAAHPLGSGLPTDPAQPADNANPPKPFGIYECNNSSEAPIGTNGTNPTDGTHYWNYITNYFKGRLQANQPCGPVIMFNSDSGSPNPRDSGIVVADGVTDPYSANTPNTEYRNALIANMIDTLAAQ